MDYYYTHYWKSLEEYFNQTEKKNKKHSFSEFLRFYVYANKEDVEMIKEKYIYSETKKFFSEYISNNSFQDLLKNIPSYKDYFDKIIYPENCKDTYIKKIKDYLLIYKYANISIFFPVLLKLIDLIETKKISEKTLEKIILLITSYALRLHIAGNKAPNKLIPKLVQAISNGIEEEEMLIDIEESFHRQKSSPFYNNAQLIDKLINKKIYSKTHFTKHILLLIMSHQTNNRIGQRDFDSLTIEHIFPQKGEKWHQDLSIEKINELNENYLNTIGNLTLINGKLNSEISNNRFCEKKGELYSFRVII